MKIVLQEQQLSVQMPTLNCPKEFARLGTCGIFVLVHFVLQRTIWAHLEVVEVTKRDAALRNLDSTLLDPRVVLLWQLHLQLCALPLKKNSVQLVVPLPMQAPALIFARRVLHTRSLVIRARLIKNVQQGQELSVQMPTLTETLRQMTLLVLVQFVLQRTIC